MARPTSPIVIFDRDGTLLDFSEMFYRFVIDLCDRESCAPPDRDTILGLDYWHGIVNGGLRIGKTTVRDIVDDVPLRYMTHGAYYAGVRDALLSLHAAGVTMAVFSGWVGTAATRDWLESSCAPGVFAEIVTADDLPHVSPDSLSAGYGNVKERLLELTIDRLGARGRRVLVVGDSPEDIRAGKQCGADTAAVKTGNGARMLDRILEMNPDFVLESAAQIPGVLQLRARVFA